MGSKKGNCPIYEDKEGCVKLAIFKNNVKNSKKKYPIVALTFIKFPFKFCQKVYITVQDVKRLEALFERMPEIKVKEKNKDGNN